VLASVPLTVTAAAAAAAISGDLASTGTDAFPWIIGALVLLILGAGALAARRLMRRRSA